MAEVTIENIQELRQEAAGLCAECLRDTIAENSAILGDLADIASNMAAVRHLNFENEELYQRSLCEVVSAVLIIAVLTAELTKRPVILAAFSPN